MKNQKGFALPIIIIVSLLILAVVAYFFSPKSITVKLPAISCMYYGISYSDGQRFKSNDGCNTCFCYKNQISCTEMACQ